jgi:hypothetical protein
MNKKTHLCDCCIYDIETCNGEPSGTDKNNNNIVTDCPVFIMDVNKCYAHENTYHRKIR